jgi:hypothetical protein
MRSTNAGSSSRSNTVYNLSTTCFMNSRISSLRIRESLFQGISGRAFASHPRGRRFDPYSAHHFPVNFQPPLLSSQTQSDPNKTQTDAPRRGKSVDFVHYLFARSPHRRSRTRTVRPPNHAKQISKDADRSDNRGARPRRNGKRSRAGRASGTLAVR